MADPEENVEHRAEVTRSQQLTKLSSILMDDTYIEPLMGSAIFTNCDLMSIGREFWETEEITSDRIQRLRLMIVNNQDKLRGMVVQLRVSEIFVY